MKHILLLIFLIFSPFLSAISQELVLLDVDENNITNDTLVVVGAPDEDILKARIFLHNNHNSDLQVWVRKIEDDLLPGTYASFCWNNFCFTPDVFEVENPLTLGSGQTSGDDDFYGEYRPQGQSGTSYVTFEFFSRNSVFETVSITVKYTTQAASSPFFGAGQATLSAPSPNPASNFANFSYEIPFGASQATMVVRDLTGRVVLEVPLNVDDNRFQLNTSGLSNGIFLYSLVVDGKTVTTRRLMVTR
jgi:hypothetical protein